MSRCIRIGHTFAWAGLQWVGQGVVRHEWGVLNTASAAFSHHEGSMVTRVAVQSRGPRRGNLPHFRGQPRHTCVCLCACTCKQTAYYTYYLHPPRPINPSSPARAAPDDSEWAASKLGCRQPCGRWRGVQSGVLEGWNKQSLQSGKARGQGRFRSSKTEQTFVSKKCLKVKPK